MVHIPQLVRDTQQRTVAAMVLVVRGEVICIRPLVTECHPCLLFKLDLRTELYTALIFKVFLEHMLPWQRAILNYYDDYA